MHRHLFCKLHLITGINSEVHCNNMIVKAPLEHKIKSHARGGAFQHPPIK